MSKANKFVNENKNENGKSFWNDTKAEAGAIKLVIGIFIIAVLAGSLLPTGVNSMVGGRNGSWTASLLSTYDALPILIVVAVLSGIAAIAYKQFE